MPDRRWVLAVALAAAVASLVLSGCDEDSIERQIGSMSASSIEQSYHVSNDPLLQQWLTNMGTALVANSQRQNIPYSYKIIETDSVNAFAAPYGHVYMCEGLVDFAKDEDEVWTVMGHETGHVVNRHAIKATKKTFMYSLGLGIMGAKSEGAAEVAGLGAGLLALRYSRDNERQADDYGTMLTYRAGHDPAAEITFFTRLAADIEKGAPSKFEEYFLEHPDTASRIARQKLRPENDPNNVNAMIHVARGYIRRAQFAHAIAILNKVKALQPQAPAPRILLADAYSARGLYAQATQCYQAALQLEQGNAYAQQGLDMVAAAPTATLPALTADEQAQARTVLASVTEPNLQPAALRAGIAQLVGDVATQIAPITAGARQMSGNLVELGQDEKQLSQVAQDAVVTGNAAIGRSNEATYQLEAVQESLARHGADLADLVADGRDRLQAATVGSGNAGDVAVLQRTMTEAARAVADLTRAADLARAAVPAARAAQDSGQNTLGLVGNVMRSPRERPALTGAAAVAARDTKAKADEAVAAVAKAKQAAALAQTRAVVARINLAALGADAALQKSLDALVSTYIFAPPAQVAEMRKLGLGYGDAAFVLAVSRSGNLNPAEFTSLGLADNSFVDAAMQAKAPIKGASLMLKFLAAALEQEGVPLAKG